MKNLTASGRLALIKLASTMPKGSNARRAVLAGIKASSLTIQKEAFWGSKKNPFENAIRELRYLVKSPESMRAHDPRHPERSGDSRRAVTALSVLAVALSAQDPVMAKQALSQVPPSYTWNIPPEVFRFVQVAVPYVSGDISHMASKRSCLTDVTNSLPSPVRVASLFIHKTALKQGVTSEVTTSISPKYRTSGLLFLASE